MSTLHNKPSATKLDFYPMDWTLAINRNREALLRVIATMYALAGLANGSPFSTLPRYAYRALLRLLRPAESAVRRLIMLKASGLVLKPRPFSFPPTWGKGPARTDEKQRQTPFQIIDPLKQFSLQTQEPRDSSIPRISLPGISDPVFLISQELSHAEIIHAAHLSNRLVALTRALANLNNQARRLARWQARKDMSLSQTTPPKPRRISPFRPGSPPGARQRRVHEVDHILRECHLLVLDRLADTS